MVITRSPLRITFGGGGTDFPSYYRENEGFIIAAAIDKYVFVTINKPFKNGIFLKYSLLENVMNIQDICHPIIRESLNLYLSNNSAKIEITTIADIPSGTGLGSSGSFTTALLKCLNYYKRRNIDATLLAELACDIEMNKLKEPIGKQDQYISAVGGITCFTFCKDDSVVAEPLRMSTDTLYDLEDNLLLFFTGYSRSASTILKDQQVKSQYHDADMIANLHLVKEMGYRSKIMLEEGRTKDFGALLSEQWEQKKRRSDGMSNPKIDEWYELGLKNGAIGGKLVGAGGGGFLLFYAENKRNLRNAMKSSGLDEIRFKFDFEGTKIIY